MQRRVPLLALLSVSFAACGRQERPPIPPLSHLSSPIVGGTVDSGDPAVVLIYNNVQGFLCSGTLIAPRVVLTAGHCSIQGETTPAPAAAASQYSIMGGVTGSDWSMPVAEVHPNPQLVLSTTNIAYDDAVLILGSDAPVAPMAWQSQSDNAVYAPGTPFVAVGYGITSGGGSDAGTKRSVALSISQQFIDSFSYGSSTANTCNGDSGGPAIESVNGVPTVIGTTSYGDQNCSQQGVDMRTDYNSGFISQYAPPAGSGGGSPASDNDYGLDSIADPVGCEVGAAGRGTSGAWIALLAVAILFSRRAGSG